MEPITLTVYGAEEKCASCIHLPSAIETFEWLEAAVSRNYGEANIVFRYVDIDSGGETASDQEMIQAIQEEKFYYPLVVIDGEVIDEGNPRLKKIFEKVDQILQKK